MLWTDSRKRLPWRRSPRSCISWQLSDAGGRTSRRVAPRATKKSSNSSSPGCQHGLQSNPVQRAIADLDGIYSYVAEYDLEAANRLITGILDHADILKSFPFIGPTYPRGAKGSLREIVYRSYRLFYDVSEQLQSVEILHVWHGAREEPTF